MSDNMVTFRTRQGLELRGTLHRLTRNQVVFETYSPEPVLRMSEVLSDFTLRHYDQAVYSGKALISNLLQTGGCTVCEALLDDSGIDGFILLPTTNPAQAKASFGQFLQHWGKSYRVLPDFKSVIGDIHSFLLDLRTWLEQIELSIRSSPGGSRATLEREWMEALTPETTAAIAGLFDRFEQVAAKVEPEFVPVHQSFARRMIHPLILASPFVYRTLQKPLGYAGDYEMVNMIMRDPYEGASTFAKAFNVCALSRPPIVAHRNRLHYLADKLTQETLRKLASGQRAKILAIGCGPAHEVQMFMRDQHCSDQVNFTLVDFDGETLDHAARALADVKRTHGRSTGIELVKKSVQQVLKQSAKVAKGGAGEQYDLIYCAGLFDYLPDPVCRSLIGLFDNLLAPGGVQLVTNVDTHSSKREMEYFLEWHLTYRNTQQMKALVSSWIQPDNLTVFRESTGINVFLEIRKPKA
jgi:extracellular factor (EF) 3-hydroxypalmitic acid methyl ester biosynthesis protein